jgi:hypothetical protein
LSDERLLSIEQDGTLFKTNKNGAYEQIGGKGEFGNAEYLEAMDGFLWTIEKGSLYKTNPRPASGRGWKKGVWKNTVALASTGDFLWTIEKDGTLYKSDKTGTRQQVGSKGAYKAVSLLCALDGKLYTVEGGTLYRTN